MMKGREKMEGKEKKRENGKRGEGEREKKEYCRIGEREKWKLGGGGGGLK